MTQNTPYICPLSSTTGVQASDAPSPLADGQWWSFAGATAADDYWAVRGTDIAWTYEVPAGALAGMTALSADMLLEDYESVIFTLYVWEDDSSDPFEYTWSVLGDCQARMVLAASALAMNQWQFPRQGAFLKPICSGAVVRPERITRLSVVVRRKNLGERRLCLTPLTALWSEPEPVTDPVLLQGAIVDALGQDNRRDWDGKTQSEAEMIAHIHSRVAQAEQQPASLPARFNGWGGDRTLQLAEATGHWATHHDGTRWWLVDPDGCAFFSSGLDCVTLGGGGVIEDLMGTLEDTNLDANCIGDARGLRSYNFLKANLRKAAGDNWQQAWRTIALDDVRACGFNTIGNWSDQETARLSGLPWVLPMQGHVDESIPRVFRDMPDAYAPGFAEACAAYAAQLEAYKDEQHLIGYFLMNEPTWGFAPQTLAEGMLLNGYAGPARAALVEHVTAQYGSMEAAAAAWGCEAAAITDGAWDGAMSVTAKADLEAFSTILGKKFFDELSAACKAVDPGHLNLGCRYYTLPPTWALDTMAAFDVFSVNCYKDRVIDEFEAAAERLQMPVLVGEWHFGATTAGLPSSGIGQVATQEDRGKAFRIYVEDAAARPWCVGVHYFILHDQHLLGRFDGENFQIGFMDVCMRPYQPLLEAARTSHERLYDVATGALPMTTDEPDYMPPLFN